MKTKKQILLLAGLLLLTGYLQAQWVIAGGNTFHNQAASNKVVIGYPPPYPNPPTAGQLVVSTTNSAHRYAVDAVNVPTALPSIGFVYGVYANCRATLTATGSGIPVGSYGRGISEKTGTVMGVQGEAFSSNTAGGTAFGVSGFASIQNCAAASGFSNTAIGVYGQASTPAACTNKGWAVYADGRTFTPSGVWTASDEKLKTNVHQLSNALDMVNRLQPRVYEFKNDARYAHSSLPRGTQIGFLAGELESVIPEAVTEAPLFLHNRTGEDSKMEQMETETIKAVNYTMLIPVLTQAIKDQQQQIAELERKLARLEGKGNISAAKGKLFQNQPNPFNQETRISAQLPGGAKDAKLVIYGYDGIKVKQMQLPLSANTTATVKAGELSAGTYIYTLVVDGVETDSKKMIITR